MADSKADILLFNEAGTRLPIDKNDLIRLASLIESKESVSYSFIECVFVDEDTIIEINKEHLDRNYVTDTISFNYDMDNQKNNVEGTLFFCAPRIKEQAIEFNQDPEKEFLRVVIHSMLHLIGYKDSEDSDKQMMTEKEDVYLSMFYE